MSTNERADENLGLNAPISRRDFLNGVAVAIGGAAIGSRTIDLLGAGQAPAPEQAPDYYPPLRTGMRARRSIETTLV